MYEKSSIKLGQVVQDEISGFEGVVSTVGCHISGCIRIGVSVLGDVDDPPQTLTAEKFFYPQQLTVQEGVTEWTDLDSATSVHFELGEIVSDRSTDFRGRVHVVNFKLFNCPQAFVFGQGSDFETHWVDEPFVESHGNTIEVPSLGGNAQSTGACVEDSPSENLSR